MAIKKCNCKHKGQDKLNGEGMRVMNPVKRITPDKKPYYRCTVCKEEKE